MTNHRGWFSASRNSYGLEEILKAWIFHVCEMLLNEAVAKSRWHRACLISYQIQFFVKKNFLYIDKKKQLVQVIKPTWQQQAGGLLYHKEPALQRLCIDFFVIKLKLNVSWTPTIPKKLLKNKTNIPRCRGCLLNFVTTCAVRNVCSCAWHSKSPDYYSHPRISIKTFKI